MVMGANRRGVKEMSHNVSARIFAVSEPLFSVSDKIFLFITGILCIFASSLRAEDLLGLGF